MIVHNKKLTKQSDGSYTAESIFGSKATFYKIKRISVTKKISYRWCYSYQGCHSEASFEKLADAVQAWKDLTSMF